VFLIYATVRSPWYKLKHQLKNHNFLLARSVLRPRICRKCVCGRGFAPDPTGELTTLPRPPSRLERGRPSPDRTRPSRLLRSGLPPPPHTVSGYATDHKSEFCRNAGRINLVLCMEVLSTYRTLYFKKIRVPSKITVLPSRTLTTTMDWLAAWRSG